MNKEPQRRYASAAEFSEDLRRHLEGLPIVAQVDRWAYRTGKFIRRNRLAAGAAALVILSLVGGIITTTFQARRAERRFQLGRQLAHTVLFDLHDEMQRLPGSTALRVATIRTVVKYLDDLARDGRQDPGLELEIALAYARVGNLEGLPFQSNLGRGPESLVNYRKAIAIFERLTGQTKFRDQAISGLIDTHLNAAQMEALLGNPAAAASHSREASRIAGEAFAAGGASIPPITQVHLYLRLADAEYDRGSTDGELAYYRKALAISQRWVADVHSAQAISSVRDAHQNIGSALARSGDLLGARESYRNAQQASEELLRRQDATQEQQYNAIGVHTALGDILAAPDDPNFGDRTAAIAQYQAALEIAERFVKGDPENGHARRIVASCGWRLGMMWVKENPALALEYHGKSLAISQELSAADPLNAEYRYHASRALIGLGEALHNLGRDTEAVEDLTRAIDLQNAIESVSPERIWNLRVLSRAYVLLGRTLFVTGDRSGSLSALQNALAAADRMLQRAPASLPHQLDRAEALEAIGGYYAALARQRGIAETHRAELRQEARSSYRQSLAIWQTWTSRKLAAPYAGRRENQAAAAIASLGPS
jgi:tetratricopeptide (TPR) repeat protein